MAVVPGGTGGDHCAVDDVRSVAGDLGTPVREQRARGVAVAAEVVVHVLRGVVARGPGVHHEDRAPGAGQAQRPGEARGPPTDDDHVVALVHLAFPRPGAGPGRSPAPLCQRSSAETGM